MKKADEMRAEYRRDNLGKGVRGKHYAEFKKGSNLVLLTPELSKIGSGLRYCIIKSWVYQTSLRYGVSSNFISLRRYASDSFPFVPCWVYQPSLPGS